METTPESHRSYAAGDLIVSCEPWLWAFKLKKYGKTCAVCCVQREGLANCSACKVHRYCSPSCQIADWKKEHKLECAVLKDCAASFAKDPHECKSFRCSCASVIILAKLIRKLKVNKVEEVPGVGRKSVEEILQMLPREKTSRRYNNYGFTALAYGKCVEFNLFPILQAGGKEHALGAGIFLLAPYRSMTAACWDTNVTMDFRARTLFVHASCDIPDCAGIQDLRFNELMTNEYCMSLWQRRLHFQKTYGYSCNCRKCTEEYEAEINPLLCVTAGCTERIPSDERALEPCAQCGAMNSDRLKTYRQMVKKSAGIWKNCQKLSGIEHVAKNSLLFGEVDAAGIMHPGAHIRYCLGVHLAIYEVNKGNYDKGLKLMLEMAVCVRNIYPKYNCDRAYFLFVAADTLFRATRTFWCNMILDKTGIELPVEGIRLLCMLNATVPNAHDWYKEARHIVATLHGEDAADVKHLDDKIADVEKHLRDDFDRIAATALQQEFALAY